MPYRELFCHVYYNARKSSGHVRSRGSRQQSPALPCIVLFGLDVNTNLAPLSLFLPGKCRISLRDVRAPASPGLIESGFDLTLEKLAGDYASSLQREVDVGKGSTVIACCCTVRVHAAAGVTIGLGSMPAPCC